MGRLGRCDGRRTRLAETRSRRVSDDERDVLFLRSPFRHLAAHDGGRQIAEVRPRVAHGESVGLDRNEPGTDAGVERRTSEHPDAGVEVGDGAGARASARKPLSGGDNRAGECLRRSRSRLEEGQRGDPPGTSANDLVDCRGMTRTHLLVADNHDVLWHPHARTAWARDDQAFAGCCAGSHHDFVRRREASRLEHLSDEGMGDEALGHADQLVGVALVERRSPCEDARPNGRALGIFGDLDEIDLRRVLHAGDPPERVHHDVALQLELRGTSDVLPVAPPAAGLHRGAGRRDAMGRRIEDFEKAPAGEAGSLFGERHAHLLARQRALYEDDAAVLAPRDGVTAGSHVRRSDGRLAHSLASFGDVGDQVRIPVGGGTSIDGYFASVTGDARVPGIIVLHELWGLNDDMRDVSDRIAAEGYAVVAPDLYSHGNKAICLTRVLSELRHLGDGQVATDIARTRSWLADRHGVDAGRIGIIGFCMGGGFAIAAAARGGFSAVSTNYGAAPKKERLGGLCPVVGSYGALDRTFAKQGERLERHLEELGIPHDIKHYEGAGHSFMTAGGGPSLLSKLPNPMHPGYSAAEADDAWQRVFRFFDQYVKEVPTVAEERAETRAAGSLPEEQAAGAQIDERQAEVILEESEERTFDRDASPDTHLEKRTSEETVEPE